MSSKNSLQLPANNVTKEDAGVTDGDTDDIPIRETSEETFRNCSSQSKPDLTQEGDKNNIKQISKNKNLIEKNSIHEQFSGTRIDSTENNSSQGKRRTSSKFLVNHNPLNNSTSKINKLYEKERYSSFEQSKEKSNEASFSRVNIYSPIDPRIKLDNVDHISVSYGQRGGHDEKKIENVATNSDLGGKSRERFVNESRDSLMPTTDNYINMLELCRPFFGDSASIKSTDRKNGPNDTARRRNSSKKDTSQEHRSSSNRDVGDSGSSSHTSFFVTTSDSSGESSSRSSFSVLSQAEKNLKGNKKIVNEDRSSLHSSIPKQGCDEGDSDSSSMVVLARSKKKYKQSKQNQRQHHYSTCYSEEQVRSGAGSKSPGESVHSTASKNDNDSTSSHAKNTANPLSLPHSEKQSGSTNDCIPLATGDCSTQESVGQQHSRAQSLNNRQSGLSESIKINHSNNGSATTNVKNAEKKSNSPNLTSRVVTDTSASDSKTNNNTSSSSGSGNGSSGSGNGSSGSGIGSSGSGNGSGGSGNETALANENFGSTSGEGNSDEGGSGSSGDNGTKKQIEINENDIGEKKKADLNNKKESCSIMDQTAEKTSLLGGNERNHHARTHHTDNQSYSSRKQHINSNRIDPNIPTNTFTTKDGTDGSHNEERSHQQKLLSKKRKRMNKRREYEEQQHYDSSDTSVITTVLQPGKPVTLDDVMIFCKKARLVIQNFPPFLIVHANAAYATLSGFDSHYAIGRPLSSLMSLSKNRISHSHTQRSTDNNVSQPMLAESSRSDNITNFNSTSILNSSQEVPFEVLIACSGFNYHHEVNLNVSTQNHSIRRQQSHYTHNSRIEQEEVISHIPCMMGVSPVVSSKTATLSWSNGKNGKNELASLKVDHPMHSNFTATPISEKKFSDIEDSKITHFAIQLDPLNKKKHQPRNSSTTLLSSTMKGSTSNRNLQSQNARMQGSQEQEDSSSIARGNIVRESLSPLIETGVLDPSENTANSPLQHNVDYQIQEDPNFHQVPLPLAGTDDEHSSSTGSKHIITCG